jgi:hypothetical protein
MNYEYLMRAEGKILDTIISKGDLQIEEGQGMIVADEYHIAISVEHFFDFDNSKKIYIVDIQYIPIEDVPDTIRTKMLWDRR